MGNRLLKGILLRAQYPQIGVWQSETSRRFFMADSRKKRAKKGFNALRYDFPVL